MLQGLSRLCPPNQRSHKISHGCDLWGLGATAYYALTAAKLQGAQSPTDRPAEKVRAGHMVFVTTCLLVQEATAKGCSLFW